MMKHGASTVLPMALPQGNSTELEMLGGGGGYSGPGRLMEHNVIKSHKRIKEGAPHNEAPPDGSRWVSVNGDVTGGPAGNPWIERAKQTKFYHTTTTDNPHNAGGEAALEHPASVPMGGPMHDTMTGAAMHPSYTSHHGRHAMRGGAGILDTVLAVGKHGYNWVKKNPKQAAALAAATAATGAVVHNTLKQRKKDREEQERLDREDRERYAPPPHMGMHPGAHMGYHAPPQHPGPAYHPSVVASHGFEDRHETWNPQNAANQVARHHTLPTADDYVNALPKEFRPAKEHVNMADQVLSRVPEGIRRDWLPDPRAPPAPPAKPTMAIASDPRYKPTNPPMYSAIPTPHDYRGFPAASMQPKPVNKVKPPVILGEGLWGSGVAAGSLCIKCAGKRKRAPAHPESAAARRKSLVGQLMKGSGMSLGEASKHIKEHGLTY